LSEKFIERFRSFARAFKKDDSADSYWQQCHSPVSTSTPILDVNIIKNRRLRIENEFKPGKSNTIKTAVMKFARSPLIPRQSITSKISCSFRAKFNFGEEIQVVVLVLNVESSVNVINVSINFGLSENELVKLVFSPSVQRNEKGPTAGIQIMLGWI
jgi:hypothetical protein